jgi:hypothetical protein
LRPWTDNVSRDALEAIDIRRVLSINSGRCGYRANRRERANDGPSDTDENQ